MLVVLWKDLRHLMRDPTALALSFLAPVVMIAVITLARAENAESVRPLIPVVDEDEGPVAGAFIELLGKHAEVVVTGEADAAHLVADLNRAPAAIVFPPGLSKRYLQGRPSDVVLLTDPTQAVALNTVRGLLLVMDQDAAELADPLHEALLVYRELPVDAGQPSPQAREQNIPGFTIMFVLLAVVFSTASAMHDERGWGTLTRILIAPAGVARLLAGTLGARFLIGFIQALGLLLFGHFAFGISLGRSPAALLAMSAAIAFAAAALGLVVAALARTREQTLPLALATTLGLSALGGLWWPISLVPGWLRVTGECFFPAWAMYGLSDLILRGRGLPALGLPLAVVVGQGVLLLAVGLSMFRLRHTAR